MSLLSRKKVDCAEHKMAWVSKSYLVIQVGLNSFWILKHGIHYVNVEPRKRIIENSNLGGARHNMKPRFGKTNRSKAPI